MSLNDILSSAVSGLAAAQAGLRTVSNNIANVNTPGYARERVSVSTGVTAGRVSGVVIGEPQRVADRYLESTVYRRAGDYGRADVTATYLDRLQALLGQPGSTTGLPARLDAITKSATAMTGSLNSTQTVAQFTADVQGAISSMQQLGGDVTTIRTDVESEVGSTVDKINTLLVRINDLNSQVSRLTGLGQSTSGAADQRMSAIEELSSLVSVNVRDQPDGRVTIETQTGTVLLDKKLRQLSYPTAGQGVSQPVYANIEVRFANDDGSMGAATGDKLDSAAVGGKLGGLLDLRDRALPQFTENVGTLFGGLAEALNSVSNAGSTVPPPASMEGRQTGLVGADRLGFTGAATFAVTKSDGTLVAKANIDFDALGPSATIDDAVAAINAGLGGAATASFTNGVLTFKATDSGTGVAIAQDATKPSDRAGVGFSQYFGMNDVIRSDTSTLVPSGFTESDPHGFGAGETAQIVLRDTSGRALTSYTLTGSTGSTVGDLITELNGSPLSDFGSFALDDRGRIQFSPDAAVTGASISIPTDSTNRFGTGRSFTQLMGLTGAADGLATAQVRPDVLADPSKLPLAQLQLDAAVGEKALGTGDTRNANAFVTRLDQTVDMGKGGVTTIAQYSSNLLGRTGLAASQAQDSLTDATARRDDALNRRDSYSGVNIDEELAQMVTLQNSYSAAARVMTTASQMYDTLIAMVG